MKPTPYEDINKVLHTLQTGILSIFGKKLVGFYLTGSLSYGDFNPDSSDLDLLVVLNKPATKEEVDLIKQLHVQVEKENEKWSNRIECSYIPKDMLENIQPPKIPRPYYGEGILYPEAHFGNEWIINNYFIYNHGITLLGPNFKTLLKSINIMDVQKACIRDLFKEWEPKIADDSYLNNSHYQSYLVLNLCRILYTVLQADAASKNVSAEWVKNKYPQWKNLIETAGQWHYGIEMKLNDQTKKFIKFTIEKVNAHIIN